MTCTYVVTGASRGIGLEFVTQISAQGHTVYALARNPEVSEKLQKLIDNKKVFVFKLDVLDMNSIKNAAEEINNASPEGIDCLINNVGIIDDRTCDILTTSGEEYLQVFNTNVVAVSNVTQIFLPLLRKRGAEKTKKILNVSSALGSITTVNSWRPDGKDSSYCVSKNALNMLTSMFANKLKCENFIVYSANPGWVKTDMGGDEALYEASESVAGMLNVLDNVTLEQSGLMIDFGGDVISW